MPMAQSFKAVLLDMKIRFFVLEAADLSGQAFGPRTSALTFPSFPKEQEGQAVATQRMVNVRVG